MTTNQNLDWSGRVALVTGGSRGIGKAIAMSLARAGAAVAVNCRERVQQAQLVADAIRAGGGRAITVPADVSLQKPVQDLIATVERELGPVDILINNAGVATVRGLDDLDEAEFDHAISVNLKSAFLCTQAVLPGMRARRWGRIVNMSSAAARGPGVVSVLYNAAKAGLEGLTRGYAVRVAKEGITVNAIAPGPIDTEMADPLRETEAFKRVPVGRLGAPEEIAQATMMVIANEFITGQTLAVNGGVLLT